jgi:hypothetical protein
MSALKRQFALCLVALLAALPSPHAAAATALPDWLQRAADGANPKVLGLALKATRCAARMGESPSSRLAVIDYSLPSTEPRLWVFDLSARRLLYRELVAHGRNSGENFARSFSNQPGSLQTSLGLFRTLGTYFGRDGYSLRMDGLEPGINDNALSRAIVIHGADYVSQALARQQGRIGRSFGCPAIPRAIAPRVINSLKDGQFVFAYYPDRRWLQTSPFLHCDGQPLGDT